MTNMAMQMMEMHQKDRSMTGVDMTVLQECIEACSACEQACTMCAGSMTGEDMARCAAMCLNTADMANAMMRTMMRPNGMHLDAMMAMLEAMVVMSTACAEECMTHADMSDDCRLCAEACRQCAMSCQSMIDAVASAMPES